MIRIIRAVCAICVFLMAIGMAMAQLRNSTITGTVTDQSGAVVPNATVTVTNEQTNVASVTKTNAAGVYTLPYLLQGQYTVTVKAPGFQTYTSSGVAVATNVTVQANAELAVGRTTQIVQVKASAAQLQTQSSNVSGGVGEHVIDTVPNINNNPLYYASLVNGVVPSPGMYMTNRLGVGYADRQAFSAMRINGGQAGNNDITLDGVPVQGAAWHVAAVIPNSDALQEVRVQTNDLPADLGGGQGVVQMITKSGTNQFHGDAHYIMRNEALNANSYSNDIQGIPKNKFRVQEGGGSIGGPVIIPKIFNGKDKVFWFFAFDRLTHATPVNFLSGVPTLDERNGDFSNSFRADNSGSPVPVTIYNPWSATLCDGSIECGGSFSPTTNIYQRQPFLDANGNPTQNLTLAVSQSGSPFPGGTGWQGAVSPYSLLYLNAFPKPNHGNYNGANSGTDAFSDFNYYMAGTGSEVRNNLNTRLDVHLGSKNSFYASGGMQNGLNAGVNQWGPDVGATYGFFNMSSSNISDYNPYVAVGDVITLNPSTLVDLHVGVQRVGTTTGYPATDLFDASEYTAWGMPPEVQAYLPIYGDAPTAGNFTDDVSAPNSWGKYGELNQDGWANKNEHQTNWDVAGSITKIAGKWTLKNGFDYRVYLGNWVDLNLSAPGLDQWSDTPDYTAQYSNLDGSPAGSPYNTTNQQLGYWPGNFAIGTLGWFFQPGTGAKPVLAAKYLAFYTQNDWKVTRRLTLNLGVRYSIQPGPTERYNHVYGVDLSSLDPYATSMASNSQWCIPSDYTGPGAPAGTCYSGAASPLAAYGMIAFPATGSYSRNLWDTTWGNISPRLGAAFRINNSTVLRGGWGRIYAPSNTGFNANTLIYGGSAFSGGMMPKPYGTNPNGVPLGTFDNPVNTQFYPALGAVQAPDLYGNAQASISVDYFQRYGYQNAYMDQWNFMLEHRFHGWLASAGYVGSRGLDLGWRGYPMNGMFNIPDTTLQAWRSEWIATNGAINPGDQQVPNPLPALAGAPGPIGNSTISLMQSEEAYLGMLGETVYGSVGRSTYNSLELRLSHSYANGLSAQFIYDWSRTTGLAGSGTGGGNGTYAESQLDSFGGQDAPGGGINYRDPQMSLMGADVPQRFVGIVTYLLPFGKGARYASSSPVINAIAGGWDLGTVITLQSGQPWGPNCGSQNGGCIPTGQALVLPKSLQGWYNGSTPVTLPDGRTFTPSEYSYLYWNPDAFTAPVVQFPNGSYSVDEYWYGTTPQYMGQLRMPYFKNVNLTLQRTVNLTERVKLQFRGEATNLFNNANFLPGALSSNGFGSPFTSLSAGDISNGAKIGENTNTSAGALNLNMFDSREVTLSLRLLF